MVCDRIAFKLRREFADASFSTTRTRTLAFSHATRELIPFRVTWVPEIRAVCSALLNAAKRVQE